MWDSSQVQNSPSRPQALMRDKHLTHNTLPFWLWWIAIDKNKTKQKTKKTRVRLLSLTGVPGLPAASQHRSIIVPVMAAVKVWTYDHWGLDQGHHDSKSAMHEPSSRELSKMWTCIPPRPGMRETAAGPPSPIADDPSALPSPASSPPSISNSFCLFTRRPPLCARWCTVIVNRYSL